MSVATKKNTTSGISIIHRSTHQKSSVKELNQKIKRQGINTQVHASYGTTHELRFIDGLGSYKKTGTSKPLPDLLRGYIKGCELRKDWGTIKKYEVLKAAWARLHIVEQGIK